MQIATNLPRMASVTEPVACPDGIDWCTGNPATHDDPREHRHESRAHALTGRYLQDTDHDSVAAVHLAALDDDEPRLVFQGTGLWPELTLAQTDDLIADAVAWVVGLIATRRRFADALYPAKTPLSEPEGKQTAAAAFSLAARAVDLALEKTSDRAAMLLALRTVLDMAEAEG